MEEPLGLETGLIAHSGYKEPEGWFFEVGAVIFPPSLSSRKETASRWSRHTLGIEALNGPWVGISEKRSQVAQGNHCCVYLCVQNPNAT